MPYERRKHLGFIMDVNFDKICVLCDKYCVRNDKYVSIIIKIKCVNSNNIDNISDIYDKFNFTTSYTLSTGRFRCGI